MHLSRPSSKLKLQQYDYVCHAPPAMDFAPYQDTAPETVRALSPPLQRSSSRSPKPRSPPPGRPSVEPFNPSSLPAPSHFSDEPHGNGGLGSGHIESGRLDVNLFETSLPLRLDYEAMLAYLLLPPAGGVLLLVMEHKSDYVRYVRLREGCTIRFCCGGEGNNLFQILYRLIRRGLRVLY